MQSIKIDTQTVAYMQVKRFRTILRIPNTENVDLFYSGQSLWSNNS